MQSCKVNAKDEFLWFLQPHSHVEGWGVGGTDKTKGFSRPKRKVDGSGPRRREGCFHGSGPSALRPGPDFIAALGTLQIPGPMPRARETTMST